MSLAEENGVVPSSHVTAGRSAGDSGPQSCGVGRRCATALAAALLAFQAFVQLHLSRADSQTTDEGVHLSAGYSYWEWRRVLLNPEHPPLVKLLAGAAARIAHPVFPAVEHPDRLAAFFYDSWRENRRLGEAFLYESGNDADRLLRLGRLPAIALTLILGAAVFAAAAAFFGPRAGVLSTAVYVLDPTIAGHGHLITTDVAVALGGVAVLAAAWRFASEQGARGSTIRLGLAVGLASIAKFTSIIFLADLAVLLAMLRGARGLLRLVPRLLAAALVAWAVVLGAYGFSLEPPPPVASIIDAVAPDNQQPAAVKARANRVYGLVRRLAVPRQYFKGLGMVIGHVANGQESFLLGRTSRTGWWYYFPVVFAAKTPVPTLILAALAAAGAIRRRRDPVCWYWLAGAAVYFLCAMTSRADLGFRHLMPAMVFLFIGIGGVLAVDAPGGARRAAAMAPVVALLVAWLAIDFARGYDTYLSYFNELVGDRGYRVATDSNLDWGQDLRRIRAYLDRHPEIEAPFIVYDWDGPSSLDSYGIRRRPVPQPPAAARGVLIINASALP